jgi:glycosyltransferase involved in cell wall biosynthesis
MISVVVPVYNRKNEIKLLLDSFVVEYQSNPVFEVIVVDDKSDDGTFELLKEKELEFDFVKLLISGFRSPGYSRNLAAQNATYEWLLFCDSDNMMNEGWANLVINKLNIYNLNDGLWFPSCSDGKILTSNLYTQKGDHLISPFYYFNNKIGEVVHCIKKEFLTSTNYFYVSGYTNDFPDLLWLQLFMNPQRKVIFVNHVIQNYNTNSLNRISTEVSKSKIESQIIHYYLVLRKISTSSYFFTFYTLIVVGKILLFASMLDRFSLKKVRPYANPIFFIFYGFTFLGLHKMIYKLFLLYRNK